MEELARRRLISYIQATKPDYIANWHHILIAEYLEAVLRGEIKKLIITAPPRHGKSEAITIRFPVWFLGHNPDKFVIVTSYSGSLSNTFSRKARDICLSARNKRIFENLRLRPDSKSVQEWETTRGGKYIASGIGGPITGKGAHLLIIEDPIKNAQEGKSKATLDGHWDWYTTTAQTRLEKDAAQIITMTRWNESDIVGRATNPKITGTYKDWVILNLPAVATSDSRFRKEGEALWPYKYPLDYLMKIRSDMSPKDWLALFQGAPKEERGEIYKSEYWQYYDSVPPGKVRRKIQSWDTAFKEKERNDFSVCVTMTESDIGYHVEGVWRKRVVFPDLVKQSKAQYELHKPDVVLIEDKASGTDLYHTLKTETKYPIKAVPANNDKVSRAHAVTPAIESGRVFLKSDAPWLVDFVDELTAFPDGAHDDQVDAFNQGLSYFYKGNDSYMDLMKAQELNVMPEAL